MATFTGNLKSNAVYASLYNMIISQEVFASPIYSTKSSLVDMSRVDGGMNGDTKLFYSTDVLKTHEWLGDGEAANLLAIDRAPTPAVQAITIDQFRQIRVTTDEYLTKQAWMNEGAFSSFNSILLGWIKDTKRVYDATKFNTYIGTTEAELGNQVIEVALPSETTGADDINTEAYNRLTAQAIATRMADLMVELEDVSRDYNDFGFLRSYNTDDLVVVWNSEAANKLRHNDLPTIFNKDNATPDKFAQYTLPARYFGTVLGAGTAGQGEAVGARSLVEKDYGATHVFPGDLIPTGQAFGANEAYAPDSTILFKIMHKRSVPYMSGFEVGTSFFNPRSLTTNNYLTWGTNTLEYLKEYPFITVKGVKAQ